MNEKYLKTICDTLGWIALFCFVTMCATLCGCGPVHQIIDPNAGDPSDCQAACDNMTKHQCPGWKGYPGEDEIYNTEDDISCEEICVRVTNAGIGLEQVCVAAADNCEAMARCQNS